MESTTNSIFENPDSTDGIISKIEITQQILGRTSHRIVFVNNEEVYRDSVWTEWLLCRERPRTSLDDAIQAFNPMISAKSDKSKRRGFLFPVCTMKERLEIENPFLGEAFIQTDYEHGLYVFTADGWEYMSKI